MRSCNTERDLSQSCGETILGSEIVQADLTLDLITWHLRNEDPSCFTCSVLGRGAEELPSATGMWQLPLNNVQCIYSCHCMHGDCEFGKGG